MTCPYSNTCIKNNFFRGISIKKKGSTGLKCILLHFMVACRGQHFWDQNIVINIRMKIPKKMCAEPQYDLEDNKLQTCVQHGSSRIFFYVANQWQIP